MKEKIENNNEKNKGVEEFVEKGESVGKVLGGYLEPSEEEPETQEENLKKILYFFGIYDKITLTKI